MPVGKSIFESRRGKVRFGDEEYGKLNLALAVLVAKCEKLIKSSYPYNDVCIRWDITETVLHDEDAECVPDSYAVIIAMMCIVTKDELRVLKNCPYTLVLARGSSYLEDQFSNIINIGDSSLERVIVDTLIQ